ncbi:MAG: glycosyltransferase family 1 protein [Planctomycetia bacterium]|nr:glycosyltransferase family 1 protein [Planctomycetia bacterium]
MRLLLVTETFPPEVNGVARTLGRWLAAFERRGHEVRVLRPRQTGDAQDLYRTPSFPLPCYPELRCGLPWLGQVTHALADFRPDLVHIATEGPLGWSALRASNRRGIPVVTSFHTNFDQYLGYYGLGWFQGISRAYLRRFHNRAAVTLTPSAAARQRLLALGIERVAVWTRGVDAEAFHPERRDPGLRASLGLGTDDRLLLYVGRLAPEKNLRELLTAYGQVRRLQAANGRKLLLALVGGGPLLRYLQGLRSPGLVLPGVQRGAALTRWYASADLFVFPSRSETFGNVVLEAMASGLPIVAFDSPGVSEQVVHGQHGLLASEREGLAAPLHRMCAEESLRRKLALAARREAEQRDWEPIFDDLERCYLHIAGQSARLHRSIVSATPVGL